MYDPHRSVAHRDGSIPVRECGVVVVCWALEYILSSRVYNCIMQLPYSTRCGPLWRKRFLHTTAIAVTTYAQPEHTAAPPSSIVAHIDHLIIQLYMHLSVYWLFILYSHVYSLYIVFFFYTLFRELDMYKQHDMTVFTHVYALIIISFHCAFHLIFNSRDTERERNRERERRGRNRCRAHGYVRMYSFGEHTKKKTYNRRWKQTL